MPGAGFLERLDANAALGVDLWDFSVRSLLRRYSRVFLGSILLRHPWRLVSGLRQYRRSVRRSRSGGRTLVGTTSPEAFETELQEGPWLVGMGFCQKPLDPRCPSGRFNHDCQYLNGAASGTLSPACAGCHIRDLAERAAAAGAAIYIMTSAVDVAHDLLLAALDGKAPDRAVLSVCPYSVPPLTLAMAISGMRGVVESYSQGACGDYATWLRADEGDKRELTRLDAPVHQRLIEMLSRVAAKRNRNGDPAGKGFVRRNNVYYPA